MVDVPDATSTTTKCHDPKTRQVSSNRKIVIFLHKQKANQCSMIITKDKRVTAKLRLFFTIICILPAVHVQQYSTGTWYLYLVHVVCLVFSTYLYYFHKYQVAQNEQPAVLFPTRTMVQVHIRPLRSSVYSVQYTCFLLQGTEIRSGIRTLSSSKVFSTDTSGIHSKQSSSKLSTPQGEYVILSLHCSSGYM
jgi:hypothetical protein